MINVLTVEMYFIGGDYCDRYELNLKAVKRLKTNRQTDRGVLGLGEMGESVTCSRWTSGSALGFQAQS